ncbi:MAG TPA: matrixin family metalloprotease, partial [Marmoricola sp.]|nr:matrixin family metalloprotease [Marmoricola sp.]
NSHRLTFGVSGQKFWLDATAANTYSPAIHGGVGLWNATSTPISYAETTMKSQSRLDFYHPANSAVVGACGYTEWYVDTSKVNPSIQNWWWAKVSLTNKLTDEVSCGPQTHRKAIVAHEQGHAMGLAHAILSDRLMYDAIAAQLNINSPQPDDVNGINYLY